MIVLRVTTIILGVGVIGTKQVFKKAVHALHLFRLLIVGQI